MHSVPPTGIFFSYQYTTALARTQILYAEKTVATVRRFVRFFASQIVLLRTG